MCLTVNLPHKRDIRRVTKEGREKPPPPEGGEGDSGELVKEGTCYTTSL